MNRGVAGGVGSEENRDRNTRLQPILNCKATFKDMDKPQGIRLPPRVEKEYLNLINEGWIPDLEGDRIVGKHRAEAPGYADF